MHCLLCHEKIPRLRVWRTKSEFCCEEHAALYKKQTLERLLVDPSSNQSSMQDSLPEPPEPQEFEADEQELRAGQHAQGDDELESWERFDRNEPAVIESVDLPLPAGEEAEQGIDDLWSEAAPVPESPEPSQQSAEDALAALRDLASRASGGAAEEGSEKESVFEMPASSEQVETPAASVEEVRPVEEALASDEPASALDDLASRFEPDAPDRAQAWDRDDEDDSSILDRLMADPLESWKQERPLDEQESAQDEVEHAAGEPLEELPAVESAARADPEIDLEAPEPDWDFADASEELSALKESLATTGAPPVRPDQTEEVDVSPVDPDWDELEAMELSDADIEPPEPGLDFEDDASAKVVAFPEPAAETPEPAPEEDAAEPGAETSEDPEARAHQTLFRPVLALVELEPDMAEWTGEEPEPPATEATVIAAEAAEPNLPRRLTALGPENSLQGSGSVLNATPSAAAEDSEADGPAGAGAAVEIAPPASAVLAPAGAGEGSRRSTELSMYGGSVDIEPSAALEQASMELLDKEVSGPVDAPFEPAGLFMDLADPAAGELEDETKDGVDVAGAGAGRRSESPLGAA